MNGEPGGTAINGLPGQVRRPRVDNRAVGRVYGQRDDGLHLHLILGRNAIPVESSIGALKHTEFRSGNDDVRVASPKSDCPHLTVAQCRYLLPGRSAVRTPEYA